MGKILVIDDEAGVRNVLARLLSEAGHESLTAPDLRQGLALLRQSACDVVYCDVRLQHELGLELLPALRPLPDQPLVIMMTGYPSLETAQRALREGAFDFLIKPILEEELLRSVNRALNAKAFQDEKEHLRLHLEAIWQSVEEALFSVDTDLRLKSANRAAEQLCGLRQEDLDRPVETLLHHCQGRCLEALRQALREGERVSLSRLVCQREGGAEQVVTITASPLRDGQGHGLGGVMAVRDETRLVLLEKSLEQRSSFQRLIGQSPAMQAVYRLIENLAEVEAAVLITGESGTGKELVAEAIHAAGRRVAHPLVKVNCVALSESLLESELFGHVRGSFTGAVRDRVGRFQEAHQGTLFLDEIGDIGPALQVRLLRVLQEGQFERVGDNRTQQVDARIIAATNQNLTDKIAQGQFREDLYFRLKVVEVNLPPLRERAEDIPLLVERFIEQCNTRFNKRIRGITNEALALLMTHRWPGNVRELGHAIEHAFVLCREAVIEPGHLPAELQWDKPLLPPPEPPERLAILQALAATQWQRDKAARHLGMSRSTFYRRLKQLGIDRR